jgi:hypothetical protein
MFGSNEYDVPVLFETGIPGCTASQSPHRVPEVFLQQVSDQPVKDLDHFWIYGFLNSNDNDIVQAQIIQLVRIQDAFFEVGSPMFMILTNDWDRTQQLHSSLEEFGLLEQNYVLESLPESKFEDFIKCGLGVEAHSALSELVLVDKHRQIRGIYNGLELDQTEKLILELKILKQQS